MNTNKIVSVLIIVMSAVFIMQLMGQMMPEREKPSTYTISVTSNTDGNDIKAKAFDFKQWVTYWLGDSKYSSFKISIGSESASVSFVQVYYVSANSVGIKMDTTEGEVLMVTSTYFRFDLIDHFSETYPNVITITVILKT